MTPYGGTRMAQIARERDEALREVARLRESLLITIDQVESCCSRSGLCIDVDRVRAEALRHGPLASER